jgi:hypothetical protein
MANPKFGLTLICDGTADHLCLEVDASTGCLIRSETMTPFWYTPAGAPKIFELVCKIPYHPERLHCAPTIGHILIRPHCVDVWHRPDRLRSAAPREPCSGIIFIAQIVNLRHIHELFLRSTDLFNIFFPGIDDALLRNSLAGSIADSYST